MEAGCYSLESHSTKFKLTTRHCNVRKRYDLCSYLIIFNIKFGLGGDFLLMCSDVEENGDTIKSTIKSERSEETTLILTQTGLRYVKQFHTDKIMG